MGIDSFWKIVVVLFANSIAIALAWLATVGTLWAEHLYQINMASLGPYSLYVGWVVIIAGLGLMLWKLRPPSITAVAVALVAFVAWYFGNQSILESFGCAFKAYCPDVAN